MTLLWVHSQKKSIRFHKNIKIENNSIFRVGAYGILYWFISPPKVVGVKS